MYIIELKKEGRTLSERSMQQLIEKEKLSVPAFGYYLIREDLLKDLLGKDAPELLYWAGKRLARKYPLNTIDEIIDFFQQAGWGVLTIRLQARNEIIFEMESELIAERMEIYHDCTFHLEAGFLAEQISFQKKVMSEAFEHPRKKGAKVQFTVKWDEKDMID
jgi:predicted hydrocarbon binding protein